MPLGVLLKNENLTADMIDILVELHKYVPKEDNALKTVFLGGDQLTCERIRNAQKARMQAEEPTERLEGFTEKVEDWHALQAYYQVIWQTLYSTSSACDQGTLYQLRNFIDRRNVVQDPKKDLHSCQSFLSVVLEALILAVFASATEISSLDCSITSVLKDELPTSPEGKIDCVTKLASKVVDYIVLSHPIIVMILAVTHQNCLAWVF